jgi:hypothetical protein
MVPTAQPRLMKRVASFILASGPTWRSPLPSELRLPHSRLYSSPIRFPVESHLLLGCSHTEWDGPYLRPPPAQHSGLQHHIRPLLTRSVKACTAPCCTWILRWVRAQRLVEFSQLRKHSSSSKGRHLSSMLRWTHTRPGYSNIIKRYRHGVVIWFKKQGSRPPIYSNRA